MLGILKMDYIKNYMHNVDFLEDKSEFNIMVIDKQNKSKDSEEYGTNYFVSNFLNCSIINNERDMTKDFFTVVESWTRDNYNEDADKDNFIGYISERGIEESVNIDKQWVEKKLKRVRLKIDKDIDIYINEETYDDISRFEIVRNGDGSINMIIKNVINYIEK